MKKLLVIVAIMALTAGLFGMNCKPGRKGMPKHHGGYNKKGHHGMMFKAFKELNLTEKQLEKVEDLKIAHKKSMIDLEASLKKVKLEKRMAMKDMDFSEAKKAVKKMYNAKEEIALKRLELHQKLYNVLTDAQKKELKEMKLKKDCGEGFKNDHPKGMMKGFGNKGKHCN